MYEWMCSSTFLDLDPCRFTPEERAPRYWVGLRDGLDAVEYVIKI
jgi:hypothetical protein